MEVYLDNAATTKPCEAAIIKAGRVYQCCYGNPSSMHKMGIEAETELKSAKKRIAGLIGCKLDELCFTSGGTESDNLAILGIAKARAKRGKHIITTVTEHPAVEQPVKFLEEQGYEITLLRPNKDGFIDLSALEYALRRDTILVSIQHVNNETGMIQDISAAAHVVKKKNPEAVFHSDGVQAFGKINIDIKNIDLYSISAHKLHAFKGTGALYIKKGLRISPLIFGGGQQDGLRSGTENTAGIASFGVAAEECAAHMADIQRHVEGLKSKLITSLESLPDVYINGSTKYSSPYILNMSFIGIRSEVLLNALDSEGIYISAGAACSSRKKKTTLDNYGIGHERAGSAIRFSFSRFNTEEEIDYCANTVKRIVTSLRR